MPQPPGRKRRKERILQWSREQERMVVNCAACGKKGFTSRREARKAAARWRGKGSWDSSGHPHVYECRDMAGTWHVTSSPAARIAFYRELGKGE
jgi:hypothetical protein